MNNILLLTDSYKFSHFKQYPTDTEKVFSYFESRDGAKFDETVFFGLQYFMKKYLEGQVVTQEKIDYAEKRVDAHMGKGSFNRDGWQHILEAHGGRLPIHIRAVPEGTVVPVSNVMMTVENTDPKVAWLTNYLESLLVNVWYPCTVATQSREMRKIIKGYMDRTGNDPLDHKLHDFAFRGVTCPEQAGLGGAAHLISFKGTDNFAAIEMLYEYYHENMAGFSIPASEHSTITCWGRNNEIDGFRNMLIQYPTGMVACVSDSYDIWDACRNKWGYILKDMIMKRDGVLVIRPDSGTPEVMVPKILEILWDVFGGTINSFGYKVLDPHVRLIQGDGIDFESLNRILFAMEMAGFSVDNIAFGSGGGLLQKMNRDTQRFAFKCSSITRSGIKQDVWKDPVTDQGKLSKRGELALVFDEFGKYQTVIANTLSSNNANILKTAFWNGTCTDVDFASIRERAKLPGTF